MIGLMLFRAASLTLATRKSMSFVLALSFGGGPLLHLSQLNTKKQ